MEFERVRRKVGRPRKDEYVDVSWCKPYLRNCEKRLEYAIKSIEEAEKHGDVDTVKEIDDMILQLIDMCNVYRRALEMEESNYGYK